MKKRAIYIAGPMTGIEDYNYPLFNQVAAELRQYGFFVLNPAEALNGDQTLDYHQYMRSAIHLVLQAWALVLLPGWENSRGARLEVLLAQKLGLPISPTQGAREPVPLVVASEGDIL